MPIKSLCYVCRNPVEEDQKGLSLGNAVFHEECYAKAHERFRLRRKLTLGILAGGFLVVWMVVFAVSKPISGYQPYTVEWLQMSLVISLGLWILAMFFFIPLLIAKGILKWARKQ